ncbi:MAG: Trans-aconitate 2-methyltransferase [Chroococcopsis gigantea SAG 12.99]|jgi:trans-aconitate methyltransferase|nr:Trans-aconitate 2-methyltransferase [Chroococcopsis gigantea SAG 12.99]
MKWHPTLYDGHLSFVWKYGESVIELLDPQPGERIIDLGCGTGHLTARIADTGAQVQGIDSSAEMITVARRNYPHLCFQVADARSFELDTPVNAVFSNAALHWVTEAETAVSQITRSLKPGGRFVAEFGGRNNVRAITTTLSHLLAEKGYSGLKHPWYFPSIGEYACLLEKVGLKVTYCVLFDRPTALDNGDEGFTIWLQMFTDGWLSGLSPQERDGVIAGTIDRLKPQLYQDGQWYLDYCRIQVVAFKP